MTLLSTIGEDDLPASWALGRKQAFMLAINSNQERGVTETPRIAKRAVAAAGGAESDEETGILSNSSSYGIFSVDGRLFSCDSKSPGFARMKDVIFLIRVMEQGLLSVVVAIRWSMHN